MNLLKKDKNIIWDEDCEQAFWQLKVTLTTPPIVEAMTSKIILMTPKNQELSKFQRIRSQNASRIKFQRFKIQE